MRLEKLGGVSVRDINIVPILLDVREELREQYAPNRPTSAWPRFFDQLGVCPSSLASVLADGKLSYFGRLVLAVVFFSSHCCCFMMGLR